MTSETYERAETPNAELPKLVAEVIVGYGPEDARLEDTLKKLGVNAGLAAH